MDDRGVWRKLCLTAERLVPAKRQLVLNCVETLWQYLNFFYFFFVLVGGGGTFFVLNLSMHFLY